MRQIQQLERVKVLAVLVMVRVLGKELVKALVKVELKLIPLHNQFLVQELMKVV